MCNANGKASVVSANGSSNGNNAEASIKSVATVKHSEPTIVKKLFTKEDTYHVHKTLGFACLLTYFVRIYFYCTQESDGLFATYPQLTLPTLALHLALNSSSFQFKIPTRRISSGDRIWPLYRWHALIFMCYCMGLMVTFYVEEHILQMPDTQRLHVVNYVLTLIVMFFADVTSAAANEDNTTIRGLNSAPPMVIFYFSYAQFVGKSFYMYFPVRRYAFWYFAVVGLQIQPFYMTLRRKNVISSLSVVVLYALLLIVNLSVAAKEVFVFGGGWMTLHVINAMGAVAFFLRAGPRFPQPLQLMNNKYFIWTVMAVLLNAVFLPRLAEAQEDEQAYDVLYQQMKQLSIATSIGMNVYGWLYKRTPRDKEATSATKKVA